ncbi:MAG: response regulator transcription factor [Arcobacter sp.]|nr:response regulator transcription factor [Arcobacter sp.]
MKILLLEDNQTLNETIQLKFKQNGHDIYSYIDGQEAYDSVNNGFSCFILDINVPNVDGIKILKKIRKYYDEVPVIIISATVELDIIRQAYDFGCNDYLKKPFFIDELEIKVNKLCKINENKITFDKNYSFDFNERLLVVEKEMLTLTQKESLFLNLLLINKNKIVSYETIQNYVWEGEFASLDAIRTVVKRLRKKLVKKFIKAYSNKGYLFEVSKTI